MTRVTAVRQPALAAVSILLASVGFYASFVARTTVEYRGTRYFTLFDDAMVSMQYARNLSNGAGLVWNADDDRVEGYTNLLWTLWMAVLHATGIPEPKLGLAVAATGAAILVATAFVAHRIVLEMGGSSVAALVATATVAFFFPLVYWTLRGLEVGLVTLLTATAILLALRARRNGVVPLAAVIVCAVLTRDDTAVLCIVIAVYAVAVSPRDLRWNRSLVLGAAIAATIVLHTAFRLWYYGEPLPNTYHLKLGGIDTATRLTRGLEALAEVGSLTLFVPIAMAVAVMASSARERFHGAPLLAGVFAVCCAYSVYVGGDAFETTQYANRFITPGVVALLILAALFVDAARSAAYGRARLIAATLIVGGCAVLVVSDVNFLDDETPPAGLGAVAVGIAALALVGVPHGAHARTLRRATFAAALGALLIVATNARAYRSWWDGGPAFAADDRTMTRYGLLLRDSTAPGTTVAVTWAGSIPYHSHRRAIDLLGKSDRHIARSAPNRVAFRPGHNKWDYAYSIGQIRPDVVAQLFGSTMPIASSLKAWGYEPVAGGRAWVRRDARGIDRARLGRFLAQEYGLPRRG
ncbi:MAG: hypothetical protein M3540_02670 [Actinomycetota bacterium]|nr:hypothetical protein [Actinomycetota bacterium]